MNKIKNKKILILLSLLLTICLIAGFFLFKNSKLLILRPEFKPVTISQLKSFAASAPLPRKDPNVKRKTENTNGYVVSSAAAGNIDSPISFGVKEGKISFTTIPNQTLGGLNESKLKTENGKTIYENLYNGINLVYTPSKQGILEEYQVRAKREINYLMQKIDITGLTYKTQADGSIIFTNPKGEFAFAIPRPVMYEQYNTKERSFGLHYEIFDVNGNTYLAKVIDKSGNEWLTNKAHYPVMIDATILLTLFSYTSYPTVDNTWTIGLQTVGSGDLTIKPSVGTAWNLTPGANPADLHSLMLTCDSINIQYQISNNGQALFPNFSCNGNIIVSTKVTNPTKQNSLDISYSGFTTTINSIVDTGKPIIISSFINPPVVKVGDTITINTQVADAKGVASVSASIGGIDIVNLSLISGDNKNGTWQSSWQVHDTQTKPYEVIITAYNQTENTQTSIGFFDPYTCLGGGDHAGADWNPATDCASGLFAGNHTNIGILNVSNGQTATVQTFDGVSNYGIATMSASTATIAGTMTATGKGWAGGTGSGAGKGEGGGSGAGGNGGGGGGHGGIGANGGGGAAAGTYYGSLTIPGEFGSGGGSGIGQAGGAGGGVISINTTGSLTVSGTISSNGVGGSGFGAGGSGGSVNLSAQNFTGAGTITANGGSGGSGNSGGGAGGRITAYFTGINTYSGSATVTAGGGRAGATDGTSFIKNNTTGDILIISNNGNWYTSDMPSWTFHDITINANITFKPQAATLLTITATGSASFGAGSTTTVGSTYTNNSNGQGVYFIITGNTIINNAAILTATGQGYAGGASAGTAGSGSGGGTGHGSSSGGGGGHGGRGGNGAASGGGTYDSLSAPVDLGSGGGGGNGGAGGAGGGAIRIATSGILTVSGSISSNGAAGGGTAGGRGAGGSLYISALDITGAGTITANGADSTGTNGGGGGRVAIYYTRTNTFTGTISSGMGIPATAGTNGTSLIQNLSTGDLLIPAANGAWNGSDMSSWTFHDLTINGSVTFQPTSATLLTITSTGSSTLASGITVTAGGSYTNNSNGVGVYFNLAGDVTIPLTTTITTTGQGYAGGTAQGSGAGTGGGAGHGFASAAGGGYGGTGGNSYAGSGGGITYGSSTAPIDLGSGGGDGNGSNVGGAGGGAIKLTTNGTLRIIGSLIANGGSPDNGAGGGGAGGSIYINMKELQGTGTLSATGGNSGGSGGGGGGGRIALYCSDGGNWLGNSLSTSIATARGSATAGASNGTVYTSNCYVINPTINGNTTINGNVQIR